MKSLITKISFVGIMLSLVPMVADCALKGKTGFGESHGCYVDTGGNDWFWYCGDQGKGCNGVKQKGNDGEKWMHHGQDFNYRDSGHQWCCQTNYPEEDTIGIFHEGDSWIVSTRKVTEQVYDTAGNLVGKCTWEEQTNICGFVDNPQDKCTEATGECEQGYVTHNKKCVKACQTGYVFASATDNNCVKENPDDPTQGRKNGYVVQCEENEFWDKKTLSCVDQTSRIQIAAMAFQKCWECGTPGLLKTCLLEYSKEGTVSEGTKTSCGMRWTR